MFSFNAVYHIENNLRLENILWFLILCNSISDTFIIWFELTIQNFLKHVFEIALGHEFWLNINWDLIKSVSDKQKNKSSNNCNEFQWNSFCTKYSRKHIFLFYKTLEKRFLQRGIVLLNKLNNVKYSKMNYEYWRGNL